MENVRPAPGEELNTGPETVPRQAATVILLRGGTSGLEVLLAQRNPQAKFMGGAWVFPGGAVGPGDGDGDAGLRAAAVRELAEEAGIQLDDPAQLVAFSRWITPPESKIRYDTWFFLALAEPGTRPRIDGSEMVDAAWLTPMAALAAGRAGEILLVFPTIKHLEQLEGFASAAALLEHARTRTISPVQPRVIGTGETARIALPGEPGYDG
jgi:8-oxo-dGTP pyrophosphatase MutT (NUDIX family)